MCTTDGSATHPFPLTRPDIRIVESSERIDEIDCLELQWWFAVPTLGERTTWAAYDSLTRELVAVTEMAATGRARLHDSDCIEIRLDQWSNCCHWSVEFDPGYMYGVIDDDEVRWLGVIKNEDNTKVFYSSTDAGFEDDWGEPSSRRLFDDGRYRRQHDGSYKTAAGEGIGAGVYDVTIGGNTHHCLRVLDVDLSEPNGGELVEAFVETGGRTVLFRRYDGRFYRGGDLIQRYPRNRRIVIDGIEYVHCDCTGRAHDTITCIAI